MSKQDTSSVFRSHLKITSKLRVFPLIFSVYLVKMDRGLPFRPVRRRDSLGRFA